MESKSVSAKIGVKVSQQWSSKWDCSRLDTFFSKLLKMSPLLLFGIDHLI